MAEAHDPSGINLFEILGRVKIVAAYGSDERSHSDRARRKAVLGVGVGGRPLQQWGYGVPPENCVNSTLL